MVTMTRPTADVASASCAQNAALLINRLIGTIVGEVRTPHWVLQVNTDDGGLFHMRIASCSCRPVLQPFLSQGYRVLLSVEAGDVCLSPPMPRTVLGLNEWPARVVLVDYGPHRNIVTVKFLGQSITLKSVHVASWLDRPLRAWDALTVRISPEVIRVVPLGTAARLKRRLFTTDGEQSLTTPEAEAASRPGR
jgi:hypothetical protein